jgi:hypothetical protein
MGAYMFQERGRTGISHVRKGCNSLFEVGLIEFDLWFIFDHHLVIGFQVFDFRIIIRGIHKLFLGLYLKYIYIMRRLSKHLLIRSRLAISMVHLFWQNGKRPALYSDP